MKEEKSAEKFNRSRIIKHRVYIERVLPAQKEPMCNFKNALAEGKDGPDKES